MWNHTRSVQSDSLQSTCFDCQHGDMHTVSRCNVLSAEKTCLAFRDDNANDLGPALTLFT